MKLGPKDRDTVKCSTLTQEEEHVDAERSASHTLGNPKLDGRVGKRHTGEGLVGYYWVQRLAGILIKGTI